jgi:hypothetical protein
MRDSSIGVSKVLQTSDAKPMKGDWSIVAHLTYPTCTVKDHSTFIMLTPFCARLESLPKVVAGSCDYLCRLFCPKSSP